MDGKSVKSRRRFLEQLGVVGAGLMGLPYIMTACTSKSDSIEPGKTLSSNLVKDIGVQIYSVRNELNEDLVGTIAAIANLGYTCIEAYGLGIDGKFFGQYTPEEFNAIVTDTGMYVASVHTGYFTDKQADVLSMPL